MKNISRSTSCKSTSDNNEPRWFADAVQPLAYDIFSSEKLANVVIIDNGMADMIIAYILSS